MARWFPRADNKGGVDKALLVGCAGALAVAGIDAYGILTRVSRLAEYSAAGLQRVAIVLWTIAMDGR